MPEIISCPGCQRKLQVPESYLGQQVQCPSCKAMFTAAAAASAIAPPATAVAPPPLLRPAEAPPSPPAEQEWFQREGRAEAEEPRRRRDDDERPRRRGRYDDDYDDDRMDIRRRRESMPHRGTTILVLGILSLVFCGVIGLCLGIPAWVMGTNDLREIRAGRMDPEGEGSTRAGQVCGMISTILSVLAVFVVIVFFLAAASRPRGW